MKKLSLKEIKKIEFELLKKFDSFCKENRIRYFLSNGTLLGAVKYGGFIPWDDDIDVLVPREDYERLITLFEDDDRYKLFAYERNQKYRYPFAKFCDMTTRKEELNINNGVDLGIDIDVFPLDVWSNDLREAKKEARSIRKNMFFLGLTKLEKADSLHPLKRLVKRAVMVCCKMLGSTHFLKKIVKTSRKRTAGNEQYVGCKSWCIYGDREIVPVEVFSTAAELEFCGMTFPVPAGYDTYLRSLYGNYEQDPPLEKQQTHHNFSAYRL